MKTLVALMIMLSSTLSFASEITVCGKFEDYGDAFQIIDGKLDPYVSLADSLSDPQDVIAQIFADEPWGKSYCVTGTVQAFQRGEDVAFHYTSLSSMKRVH